MEIKDVIPVILTVVGTIVALISAITNLRSTYEQTKKARERVEKAEERFQAEPEKIKPAWDLARATLEAYFNRNLSQISSIYWLSVIVMLVGFGILIWGISNSFTSPTIAPAAIASVSGVITEFIGATFLFIYRSTIQQAINYSRTLERINSVGMAMQILDTMPDEIKPEDLKSTTKAKLVEILVRRAYDESKKIQEISSSLESTDPKT